MGYKPLHCNYLKGIYPQKEAILRSQNGAECLLEGVLVSDFLQVPMPLDSEEGFLSSKGLAKNQGFETRFACCRSGSRFPIFTGVALENILV